MKSSWKIVCCLLGGAGALTGEVLYNGIELPAAWPPRRSAAELRSLRPMPVPYLERRPEVVRIDVGRQLFVDDFLIEQSSLRRRFHVAEPYAGNPILRPEKRWETLAGSRSAMAFSDGCFYDPQDRRFKMWYRPSLRSGTCLITSEDGLRWQRPALDVQPGTNVVLLAGQRDSSTVWLDHDAVDAAQRFKLLQFHRDCWRTSVHTSPDGVHWSAPIWTGPTGDRTTMFYNPFRRVWVYSLRAEANSGPWNYETKPFRQIFRARKYWEARDFLAGARWTGGASHEDWPDGSPQFWLAADELDSPGAGPNDIKGELYNFDAAPYESLMLGWFSVLRPYTVGREANRPKINDLEYGFSRDGYHWDRPIRQAVITVNPDPKAWNHGNVQSVGGGGLIVGDRFFVYASGRNALEDSTGLWFFRRDGFAAMEAGDSEGALTTRPVVFSGRRLFVNVAAPQGELRVEVVDRAGRVVAPFTRENCVPLALDRTLAAVHWRGAEDLRELAGQPVRFRFLLRQGALYSFWVSADDSGASRGFVAAGGPGFTGATDTVGARPHE
jgi:hypothetical protein